jgi:hypothetical protein
MTMAKRERLLAACVAILVAGYLGNWIFSRLLRGPLDARHAKVARLKSEVSKKQLYLRQARKAAQRLERWQAESLPSNLEFAGSLYQEWLLEQVRKAGFKTSNVDSGAPMNRKGIYQVLPFSIRGRGTLEQLTLFLYAFYRADHLHQITRLNLTPLPKSNELELALAIEALVLPTADRADKLASGTSKRLASDELAAYRPIVDRNLFGQVAAGLDPADFAYLTAILMVDGTPQAWVTVRTTGQILKLRPGDNFEVGQFRGSIVEINSPDIIIDADEEHWLLTLGEKLSQATALPPAF